jgi:hypothetical protein
MVPFSGASGVLVGADDRGIHHHLPVDLTDRIGLELGVGQQPLPSPVGLPAAEPLIAGLPGAIALGQVSPGHPCGQLPQDPVHHLAMVGPLPAGAAVGRQQRGDLRPGLIGELVAWRLTTCPPRQAPGGAGNLPSRSCQTRPSRSRLLVEELGSRVSDRCAACSRAQAAAGRATVIKASRRARRFRKLRMLRSSILERSGQVWSDQRSRWIESRHRWRVGARFGAVRSLPAPAVAATAVAD